MDDFVLAPGFSCEVPRMMDYFGLWSIQPDSFRPLVNRYNGINVNAHIVSNSAQDAIKQQESRKFYATKEGVALFDISGPMMKAPSSMSGGVSTVRVRQQLRQAREDDSVIAGMLRMDTPGGAVKGNSDLADEVARFAAVKPIFAFVEDLTASAGVSVASQATAIYANNANAIYGHMGTYAVLVDESRQAENLGLKVHVVKAGDFKGVGEPGVPFTESQLAEMQRVVNKLNESYLTMIATGRGQSIENIRALADGRAIFGADALAAGLIDGIGTYSEVMERLLAISKGTSKPKSIQYSDPHPKQSTKPITSHGSLPSTKTLQEVSEMEPATLKELKAQFPNADAAWLLSQIEAEATIVSAATSYARHVEEKSAAAIKAAEEKGKADAAKAVADAKAESEAAIEAAKAEAAKKSGSLGAKPFTLADAGDEHQETGNAVEDFEGAVANHMLRYKCSREDANTAVRRNHRELTQAYLLATNPSMHATRILNERMDAINRAEKRHVNA